VKAPIIKTEGKDGTELIDKDKEAEEAPAEAGSDEFIPLILFIHETSHLEKVVGKEFEKALGEELNAEVPFARIGKYDGNVVFDANSLTQEVLDKLLADGFTYNDQKVTFKAGNDKEVEEFMRNHGRHVGKIIQKSNNLLTQNTEKRWGSLRRLERRNLEERSNFAELATPPWMPSRQFSRHS
jgi:hypothetical protein